MCLDRSDIIRMPYEIKSGHLPRARFVMHRKVLQYIRTLKDSSGRFLWEPGFGGIADAQPSTIAGFPYNLSEYAPSDVATSGAYVCVFGDMSMYHIADASDVRMQRSEHRFVERDETYLAVRRHTDGAPVLDEAFVRLKVK